MNTNLNAMLASEHMADVRRAAARRRSSEVAASSSHTSIVLRGAQTGDAPLLNELAELDEAQALSGDAMLALIDGRGVAAISLDDGRVISDPFVATADAVALLKLRAKPQGHRRVRQPRRRWRPRFA